MSALLTTLAVALAFVSGYALSQARRRTTQLLHDRAVEQFTRSQALEFAEATADLGQVIIAFDEIRLRYVGTDRQGVEVYVNAEPFPSVGAIAVENLPPQSAIVIIGEQP